MRVEGLGLKMQGLESLSSRADGFMVEDVGCGFAFVPLAVNANTGTCTFARLREIGDDVCSWRRQKLMGVDTMCGCAVRYRMAKGHRMLHLTRV